MVPIHWGTLAFEVARNNALSPLLYPSRRKTRPLLATIALILAEAPSNLPP